MPKIYSKGIVLEQNKEPAFSRALRGFFSEAVASTLLPLDPVPEGIPEAQTIIDIAREAKIIDETDGRPLHLKLETAVYEGVQTLVVDAIDDEPYISSQMGPLLALTDDVLDGLALARAAVPGCTNAYIAVYRNLADVDTKIPRELGGVRVERIAGAYPAEYRSKRLFKSSATLLVGTCALIHLHRAVRESRVHSTAFITVAGDCIAYPCNLEVYIGASLHDVLMHCGLVEDPMRVVVGGSMTGFCVTDTSSTLVAPTTRGVLAFKEDFKELGFKCIGCGRCSRVCPEGLSPYYIYKFLGAKKYEMLENFDISYCTGCGTCSYICPAKLDISQTIVAAKRELGL